MRGSMDTFSGNIVLRPWVLGGARGDTHWLAAIGPRRLGGKYPTWIKAGKAGGLPEWWGLPWVGKKELWKAGESFKRGWAHP